MTNLEAFGKIQSFSFAARAVATAIVLGKEVDLSLTVRFAGRCVPSTREDQLLVGMASVSFSGHRTDDESEEVSFVANEVGGFLQRGLAPEGERIELTFGGFISARGDGGESEWTRVRNDLYLPTRRSRFTGTISGELGLVEGPEGSIGFGLVAGVFSGSARDERTGFDMVTGLLPQAAFFTGSRKLDCALERRSLRGRIGLYATVFAANEAEVDAAREAALVQIGMTQRYWGPCCLEISPTVDVVVNERIAKSRRVFEISEAVPEMLETIEIAFVRGELGVEGLTLGPGDGFARCIVRYGAGSNNLALAHEIGHVFAGDHPSGGSDGLWAGSVDAVLDPNAVLGGGRVAGNTVEDCRQVRNGLLERGARDQCCFSPFI